MQPEASSAILTVPNLLTFARIALVPVFLWVALGPDHIGAAFAVAAVALATDLVDGKIARRYGQVSKLGITLDPLSDRLGLAAGAVVLVAHDLAPLWAVLVIIGRDAALVLIGAPVLKARGAPIPPVSQLGKKASFLVSLAFGLLLAAGIPGVDNPSRPIQVVAWIVYAIAAPLYYVTAAGYIREGLSSLDARAQGAREGSRSEPGG